MKINKSKATFSSIVSIGEKIKKISQETGNEYLSLNRGINSVINIDLNEIIKEIDFNSSLLQTYAPNSGIPSLKKAIINEYNFNDINKVFITAGGMTALDFVFQILEVDNFYLPKFFWGSYSKVAKIRGKEIDTYNSIFDDIKKNSAIILCYPNNPTGENIEDSILLSRIKELNNNGTIIIFDSPYRKVFVENDMLFEQISKLDNVIITESFSKYLGLSGQRLGFIYCNNIEFNEELNIRMLYELNGVNAFAQILVEKLLTSDIGKRAANNFRKETTEHIKKNIQYLSDNNLLPKDIYNDSMPVGIFAIINKTEEFLFKNRIGAVGLDKFVNSDKEKYSKYSRICVSVRHELFTKFLSEIINIKQECI